MKRHAQFVVALLWVVLGLVGAVVATYQSSQEQGGRRNWLQGYGIATVFCVLSVSSAIAYLKRVNAGKVLLLLSSAILALYCLSYILMVGSEFGPGSLAVIAALLLFATGTLVILSSDQPNTDLKT